MYHEHPFGAHNPERSGVDNLVFDFIWGLDVVNKMGRLSSDCVLSEPIEFSALLPEGAWDGAQDTPFIPLCTFSPELSSFNLHIRFGTLVTSHPTAIWRIRMQLLHCPSSFIG